MTVVSIVRPRDPVSVGNSGHPKVELVQRGGDLSVVFPFAPSLAHDGLARRKEPRDRTGRKPRLADGGPSLRATSFEALFAYRDDQESVESLLTTLERIAGADKPVKWRNYGPGEAGWYSISSLSIVDVRRQEGTNYRTRASVLMTLTEDPDVDVNVGPASGGAKDSDPDKGPGGKWPKSYTVKEGDTLHSIAFKFYGSYAGGQIAKANSIRDPRKLRVGQKLKIPRPA